ncbi:error-prone DNA polymerase [Ralstonia solanacearum]|uniref:Error-prone DNA polymerase n=1 Tax=Ralstonia solanacearum TaxID=305 RepID=A0AAE3ND58_RALSL|nr:error-prone DNA polymerase [Ralstonia solanacearum]MBB6584025.1 error-prone DNA polymerase [Ralstonia solanacearum]MDB0520223.1 error-prone DNA polymerase [Ralstonia solanacearum]
MNASTPPPIGTIGPIGLPDYAELHCISNFTFLTGASHPHELVARAKALGYRALALTDECSVAGSVRAHVAAKEAGLKLIVGSRFTVRDAQGEPWLRLVLLAQDIDGYGNLCECITQARLAAPKGDYRLLADDLAAPAAGLAHLRGMPHCLAILLPDYDPDPQRLRAQALWCRQVFGDRLSMALELPLRHADDRHRGTVAAVSEQADVSLVATGDVAMHSRQRKPLHDVLTAIRLSRPIAECGLELAPSAEQAMRTRMQLAFFYQGERGAPLLRRSVELASLCDFSLDEIEYEYPHEVVPEGLTPAAYLHAEVMAGAARRYGKAIPAKVRAQIAEELALIAELRYEPFFLTVYDVVRFARSRDILCQGRGSAANSAVCYCLGITEVDPESGNTLFARFLSRARNEPPDIDVDFEHQRREEVIQYIYGKYGLTRTALAAALITYRTRSALRDVGRALGIDLGVIEQVAKAQAWWDGQHAFAQHAGQQGLDPESPLVQRWAGLVGQLRGFPRHLSQHVGGFVIAQGKLSRLVPIENAAMQDRRVIQWDKDDLESLRLLKVDVLALGMLTAIRRTLDMLDALPGRRARYGASDKLAMQHLPDEDRDTYDMISRAETIGVFQIESRAQQSMLPRLRPRTYYDLVIQVAIVRPGPIQGGMVHPYLQRREAMRNGNPDCVTYPGPEVRAVLERTLGVPIFQEQVMEIAMKAGGFTADEADRLRRDMAAWKRKGNLTEHQERLMKEMVEVRHYDPAFVEALCRQMEGFAEYGFPESHAAGFAKLAYVSSYLKCHEPAAFFAALLNSQPMGFYSPSQLVQEARRSRVRVLPADVTVSAWDSTLHERPHEAGGQPDIRLGLSRIRGMRPPAAERIVAARAQAPFASVEDLAHRAALDRHDLSVLAAANALLPLAGHRRQALWQTLALQEPGQDHALLRQARPVEAPLALPAPSLGEEVVADYGSLGLSLQSHPLSLLRPRLERMRFVTAATLAGYRNGQLARACGIVTVRQRPGTAKGTIFVSIEDETGVVNVVLWPRLIERQRREVLHARLLGVYGAWQCERETRHLVAQHLVDLTPLLGRLASSSRDFH